METNYKLELESISYSATNIYRTPMELIDKSMIRHAMQTLEKEKSKTIIAVVDFFKSIKTESCKLMERILVHKRSGTMIMLVSSIALDLLLMGARALKYTNVSMLLGNALPLLKVSFVVNNIIDLIESRSHSKMDVINFFASFAGCILGAFSGIPIAYAILLGISLIFINKRYEEAVN